MSESTRKRFLFSICWDCHKATGKCSWSEKLKPVKGWKATPTQRELYGGIYKSYIVLECPEFERDAWKFGTVRYKNEDESMSENH